MLRCAAPCVISVNNQKKRYQSLIAFISIKDIIILLLSENYGIIAATLILAVTVALAVTLNAERYKLPKMLA